MRLRLSGAVMVWSSVLQAIVQVTRQKPTGAASATLSQMFRESEKSMTAAPKPTQVRVHHHEWRATFLRDAHQQEAERLRRAVEDALRHRRHQRDAREGEKSRRRYQ